MFFARGLLDETWAAESESLVLPSVDWEKTSSLISPQRVVIALTRLGRPLQISKSFKKFALADVSMCVSDPAITARRQASHKNGLCPFFP